MKVSLNFHVTVLLAELYYFLISIGRLKALLALSMLEYLGFSSEFPQRY